MGKLTKILITMFLMVIVLSGMSTLTAEAAGNGKYFQSGELYYHTISKNKVEVCGTTREEGTLVIPSSVYYKGKKYTVTQIADQELSELLDKYIEQEVTNGYELDEDIPGARFYDYEREDGEDWPKEAGVERLYSCTINKVILPNTLTRIGDGAFGECVKLQSVVFTGSYKKLIIGDDAFCGISLKSIRFPEGTYELGDRAAGSVQEIYIPSTVKKIGAGVVNFKTKKVTISKKNKKFKMKDGILYSYNEKTLISASAKVKKNVKISKKTTKIRKNAFLATNIKTITLNNKIKTIPEGAFNMCKKLVAVKKTDSIKKIDYAAFADCEKLKDIGSLPNLTEIGRAAFWSDGKLALHLSEKVITIDDYAFAGGCEDSTIQITVDANNPICSIENGFLMKTTDNEKTIIMQMFTAPETLTIPEGVTKVASKIGGMNCKQVTFPTTLKTQSCTVEVNDGTVIYQTIQVPELEADFDIWNCGKGIITVIVPKGAMDAYRSAIDDFTLEDDDTEFFLDHYAVIKEQE